MKDWTINKMNDVALLEIQVPDKPATNKWEKWILLTSDWHWDNAHCDLNLLKRDLNQAVERDAPHEWMQPYKDNFCFASRGNHEISNLRNNDTDVIERFCERMRFTGSNIVTGGIGGWIFIRCILNNRKYTLKVAYHHGAGGGGPVTKGVIKANRRSQYLPQADFVVSGHIHERWAVTNVQEHVSDKGKRSLKEQTHISLPTYKQEYHPDGYDFHVLNERPPKPLGGCWLRLHYVSHDSGATPKAEIIFT
jgi:hypothetical protein